MTVYSTLITDYIGEGLATNRPTTPPIAPSALGLYYATDTGQFSLWNGSGWVNVLLVTSGGGLEIAGGLGAFGTTPPSSRPSITGSRGAATAAVLESTLQALQAAGLLTDNTTA